MHKKDRIHREAISHVSAVNSFSFEAHRTPRGLELLVFGVLGVSELTETHILLSLRGGEMSFLGERLMLTALENKTVEVIGVIKEMDIRYVKIKA